MASSPSWFTSVACNASSIHQRQSLLQWLGFILLSPCPQRLLFSAVDAVFLLLLLAFTLHKLLSRLINRWRQPDSFDACKPLLSKSALRTDLRFKLTFVILSLLTASFAILLVLALTGRLPRSQWQIAEATFLLLQFSDLPPRRRRPHRPREALPRRHPSGHPPPLLDRLRAPHRPPLRLSRRPLHCCRPDLPRRRHLPRRPRPLPSPPLSCRLRLHRHLRRPPPQESEHPTGSSLNHPQLNVTLYATASLLSCITWSWMNPLISKGYCSALSLDDVPALAPDHLAEGAFYLARVFY